ncbi:MAG: type II secretion system F family protein [Candidatus Cloacimonetes bacterium]|nr:type II secretion system F family protein [Candidatus Cloacimonadota bacterium]
MIKEFRFKGLTPQGRLIQGTVLGQSKKDAKRQVDEVAKRNNVKITDMNQKLKFRYTIKLPGKKKNIVGVQNAYSKMEVAEALQKMGYRNFRIEPIMDFMRSKPSSQDVQMFIKLSANMLRDKMSFGKVLGVLIEEQSNNVLKESLQQIEQQLKKGQEGKEVFKRYTDVFGKFPAYMLGLATKSGNMADIFEATNKFIERDNEIQKNLKKALVSPMFAVAATLGAVGYYVLEIFPSTASMFAKFDIETPPLTKFTLELSDWLGATWWILLLMILIPVLAIWRWWSTPQGAIFRDKMIIKIPVLGPIIHKTSIEIYFRVFATIYAGSADNIETIRTSSEACRNKYMEREIKEITIPQMLKEGEGFVPAMEAAGIFPRTVITRLRSGSETGNILQSAVQIASFYEAETTYKMDNIIEYTSTIIGLFISLVIAFLTMVSAEIATVSPSMPGVG